MKSVVLSSLLVTSVIAAPATEPATLLDLSHGYWPAARLSDAVLVIVDAQRGYTEGVLTLPEIAPTVDAIAELLTRARAAGTPVIHVVQHGKAGGTVFDPNTPAVEILPSLTPAAGETIIVKHLPNSFADTTLEVTLQRLGRRNLIVVGFMTHMCVSTTVRAALDHGYRCTVPADCCSTRDLPDGVGGRIAAGDIQRTELAALADRFATIVPRARLIRE